MVKERNGLGGLLFLNSITVQAGHKDSQSDCCTKGNKESVDGMPVSVVTSKVPISQCKISHTIKCQAACRDKWMRRQRVLTDW